MVDFEYIVANDFDRAWLNFEPDLPLEPMPDGGPNPFYVERPGNAVALLEESLLAPYYQPPKYFLSGHRGCGKSTELRRLAVKPAIRGHYWPVHFTIRDEADINNLDFRDVLLAIGGRMYRQYHAEGNQLPAQLLRELNSWRGQVTEEVTTLSGGRIGDFEVNAGLDAFFAKAGLKMKLEPATRDVIRQVFDRNITGLINVINDIATAIHTHQARLPLILIDDIDKTTLELARNIFYNHREVMLQPLCAIVYTVSSSLFYSREFAAIQGRTIFLPNVKLHAPGKTRRDHAGYETMREFVRRRLNLDLIAPRALDEAVRVSGGVFREMVRVMRSAILRARRAKRVELIHVRGAETEISGEYRRLLTAEQRARLRRVRASNQLDEPDKIAPLLQILAVLEYANGEPWCDVHPALVSLLEDTNDDEASNPS